MRVLATPKRVCEWRIARRSDSSSVISPCRICSRPKLSGLRGANSSGRLSYAVTRQPLSMVQSLAQYLRRRDLQTNPHGWLGDDTIIDGLYLLTEELSNDIASNGASSPADEHMLALQLLRESPGSMWCCHLGSSDEKPSRRCITLGDKSTRARLFWGATTWRSCGLCMQTP